MFVVGCTHKPTEGDGCRTSIWTTSCSNFALCTAGGNNRCRRRRRRHRRRLLGTPVVCLCRRLGLGRHWYVIVEIEVLAEANLLTRLACTREGQRNQLSELGAGALPTNAGTRGCGSGRRGRRRGGHRP